MKSTFWQKKEEKTLFKYDKRIWTKYFAEEKNKVLAEKLR